MRVAISNGIAKLTTEGIKMCSMSLSELTLPAIQSMVVVTSPIGDQAPPALAAMTTNPAIHMRSSLSATILRRIEINTIVAVRLSIIADNTNPRTEITNKS